MPLRLRKRERQDTYWVHLRKTLRPHRRRVVLLACSSFATGAVEAAMLVAITRVALALAAGDRSFGLIAGREMTIGFAVAATAGLVVLRLVLAVTAVRFGASLVARISTSVRRDLAVAYLGASWATQQSETRGRLQELLMSYAGSVTGAASSFAVLLNAGLSLSALVIGSVFINPVAMLVVLVLLVVLGSVLAPLRRRIRRIAGAASDAQMEFATAVAGLGELGVEMQAYGVREQFVARVNLLIEANSAWRARAGVAQGLLAPVYTSLAFIAIVGGLGFASALDAGELGGAAAVMLVMLRALSYGQGLQSAAGTLSGMAPYIESVESFIEHYRSEPAELGSIPIEHVGRVEFSGVSFEYQPGESVLADLSFVIEPGEIIGVIGPSGGGKSTLVQLLLGLRNPTLGSVQVNGIDLRQVERTSWAARTAYVAQDAHLLPGSIASNIVFFRPDVERPDIRRAAEQANMLPEIEALPEGFDTPVGEGGGRLSGGQRQRISIARALAGTPDLLILDEPTSALDARSEQLICDTIAAVRGDVSVVIVAHRLSTLEVCDRIMVIDEGAIQAFAPAADLVNENEFFRRALQLWTGTS